MAKEKYFFYECIKPVEVIFMAHDQRRERWPRGTLQPPLCEHPFLFQPENVDIDPPRPSDILVTNRPIAAHFTEEIEKEVSRRVSLEPGKRDRKNFETTTKPKFLLLDSQPPSDAKRRTLYLDLRECDYLPLTKPGPKAKTKLEEGAA